MDGSHAFAFIAGLFMGGLCMLPELKRAWRKVAQLQQRVMALLNERADAPREAFRERLQQHGVNWK